MYRHIGFKHDANNCDIYELYNYFDNQSFKSMYGGLPEYRDLKNIYEARQNPPKTESIDYSEQYPARIPSSTYNCDYDDDDYDQTITEHNCFGNSYYGVTMKNRDNNENEEEKKNTLIAKALKDPQSCPLEDLKNLLANETIIKKYNGTKLYANLMKTCHTRILTMKNDYYYNYNNNIYDVSIYDFNVAVKSQKEIFYFDYFDNLLIPNKFNDNDLKRSLYVTTLYEYVDSHDYDSPDKILDKIDKLESQLNNLGQSEYRLPEELPETLNSEDSSECPHDNNDDKNRIAMFLVLSIILVLIIFLASSVSNL